MWILLGLEFYLDFILKAFLNYKLMSLSIDALTSALLGCHQSAHCAPETMAPAVSGWRRLTERRRRRLVTSVKVSFLHPPPVSTATTSTDSHIMITTQPYTNHDSLIDWILQQETQFLKHLELSVSCVETEASVQPNICCVLGVLATFPSKITQFLSYQISARQ